MVLEARGQEPRRRFDGTFLAEEQEAIFGHGHVERRALRLPLGNQLGDRARIHHRARENVRADLGAFLEHADRNVGRELLRADGGRESRGTGADDHDVVLHRFARHAAIIIGAPCPPAASSCMWSAFRSAGATWTQWATITTRCNYAKCIRSAYECSLGWCRQ